MQWRLGPALSGQLISYFSKNPLKPPSEPSTPNCQQDHQEHSLWSEMGDILSTVVTMAEDAPKPR